MRSDFVVLSEWRMMGKACFKWKYVGRTENFVGGGMAE